MESNCRAGANNSSVEEKKGGWKVLWVVVERGNRADGAEKVGTTMHRNAGTGHHGALDLR